MEKPRRLGGWALPGLAFIWLAAITGLYYVTHKPISPENTLVLLTAVFRFGVSTTLVCLGGGVGARLLPAVASDPLTRLTLQAAFGLGLLSLLVLAVGTTLGVIPWLFGAMLALGVGLLRRSIFQWLQEWAEAKRLWLQSGRLEKTVLALTAWGAALSLATALAPPLHWDALTYHLALPAYYIEQGRMIDHPGIMFWGMPEVGEMLYTWAMALGGGATATVLGWMMGLLAVAGLWGWIGTHLSRRAAVVGIGALLSGTTLMLSLAWGYVDWLSLLFGFGFLVMLHRWTEDCSYQQLILAGVFAGLTLGTKYTGGSLSLIGALWIMVSLRQKGWQERIKAILLFGGAALLVFSPWLIRNIVATGSPIYPLFWPAGAMDTIRLRFYQDQPLWGNEWDLLALPLRATFLGVNGLAGYSASIGPLLLGFGALCFLRWQERSLEHQKVVRLALGVALPGILIWAIGGRFSVYLLQTRLHFSIFPALAVLAGAGFWAFERMKLPGVRLGRIGSALLVLVLTLNSLELTFQSLQSGAIAQTAGFISPADYLENNLGAYGSMIEAVNALPPPAHVLMLWETRGYYCGSICEPDEIIDRWWHLRREGGSEALRSSEQILEEVRRQGYTHVLINLGGAQFVKEEDQRFLASDWQALDAFLQAMELEEDFSGQYRLYKIVANLQGRTP